MFWLFVVELRSLWYDPLFVAFPLKMLFLSQYFPSRFYSSPISLVLYYFSPIYTVVYFLPLLASVFVRPLTGSVPWLFQSGFGERDCAVTGQDTISSKNGACNPPFKWKWVKIYTSEFASPVRKLRIEFVVLYMKY